MSQEIDKDTQRVLLMWKMGLGNSNLRLCGEDFNPKKVERATVESWKTEPMVEPAINVDLSFRVSEKLMDECGGDSTEYWNDFLS